MQENKAQEITFWDHLDELRKVFFRIALIVILLMVVAFLYKDTVFDIILAPRNSDFILYQWINRLGIWIGQPSIQVEPFDVELINIELASQFFIHMSTSFYVGILLASPYILYEIYRFVSPALYEKERNISVKVLLSASLLFLTGVLLNYFLIFPLSFRFLANYHVSELIDNKISISSYIDTFLALSVMLGATFEIPVLTYFFAKLGFITSSFLKKYRRQALVVILIVAAIITPTTDIFTLLLVSIPMYALYELSIGVVKMTRAKTSQSPDE